MIATTLSEIALTGWVFALVALGLMTIAGGIVHMMKPAGLEAPRYADLLEVGWWLDHTVEGWELRAPEGTSSIPVTAEEAVDLSHWLKELKEARP